MPRVEGRLFYLFKVVVWISVQHELANLDRRIVRIWPYLGHIPGIEAIPGSIGFGPDLHLQRPRREVPRSMVPSKSIYWCCGLSPASVAASSELTQRIPWSVLKWNLTQHLSVIPFRKPVPYRTIGLAWRPTSPRGDEYKLLGELLNP